MFSLYSFSQIKKVLILLCLTSSCWGVASSSKLNLSQQKSSIRSPEDAMVYWFPVIDKIRVLNFYRYSMKLDYQKITIRYRGRPIPDSRVQVLIAYVTSVDFESQIGYMNSWDIDRWVFFAPRSYSIGISPLGHNGSNNIQLRVAMRVG